MIDGESSENIKANLDALRTAAKVALARINEWEADNLADDNCRDWIGHVQPALEQLRVFVSYTDKERMK